MRKRIVYNRHDGGVSVCCPTDWAVAMMGCGGLWDSHPRGYMEIQIERQIARGIRPDDARRYAMAMQFGGCTTAEALEIIRDRDCAPHGTAIELWDLDDVPNDRWFRDAWRRSPNGGPISIDIKLAKPIQFRKAHDFVEHENRRRAKDFDLPGQIDVDWLKFRERVLSTQDEHELRAVWPYSASLRDRSSSSRSCGVLRQMPI